MPERSRTSAPSAARFSADLGDLVTVDQDVDDTVKLDGRIDDVGIPRSKAIIGTSKQQIQDSHTHADTGVDLLQDDGALRVVGHIGVELDAAVDGARVADDRIGVHELLAVLGQAEELVILANGWGTERPQGAAARAACRRRPAGRTESRSLVTWSQPRTSGAGGSSVPGATA